jgi:hypothetical protein
MLGDRSLPASTCLGNGMAESFVERRAGGRGAPGRIGRAARDDPKVIHLRRGPGRSPTARAATTREVIAVFDSLGAVQEALKVLESNGFDRSQIRVLATRDVVERDLADWSGGLSDAHVFPAALHGVAVPNVLSMTARPARPTRRTSHASTTFPDGSLAGIVVMALANSQEAQAHLPGPAISRLLRDDVALYLQEQVSRGRMLVWVSLRRPEREATAREILARHAKDVRAYMS